MHNNNSIKCFHVSLYLHMLDWCYKCVVTFKHAGIFRRGPSIIVIPRAKCCLCPICVSFNLWQWHTPTCVTFKLWPQCILLGKAKLQGCDCAIVCTCGFPRLSMCAPPTVIVSFIFPSSHTPIQPSMEKELQNPSCFPTIAIAKLSVLP